MHPITDALCDFQFERRLGCVNLLHTIVPKVSNIIRLGLRAKSNIISHFRFCKIFYITINNEFFHDAFQFVVVS